MYDMMKQFEFMNEFEQEMERKYEEMENMTPKVIITSALLSTGREGMRDLIDYMDKNGFFTAPSSTQYHTAIEGGLAEHSINVLEVMHDIANKICDEPIDTNSIIIVALLHDLGKVGQYGKPNYVPNILKSGKLSESKPYETNKDLIPVPHEIRSIQIASQFIELSEQESFAILQHNGMYGDLKYSLQGKETPLQMLLHFSDMWASRVIEKEI